MAGKIYSNIKSAAYNPGVSVPLTGVLSVSTNIALEKIFSKSDDNLYKKGQAATGVEVTGSIEFEDISYIDSLTVGDQGELTFIIEGFESGTDITFTIDNVMFDFDLTGPHQDNAGLTLNWEAVSDDGSTSPLATSVA